MKDEQRKEINATIARAMGWTRTADEPNYGYEWRDGTGMLQYSLPDFTHNAAASRSLVEWLDMQDGKTQASFRDLLWMHLEVERIYSDWRDALFWLTAPMEAIAQAAFQAIGGKLDE